MYTASTDAWRSSSRSWSTGRGYLSKSSPPPNWSGFTKMLTTTREFSALARAIRLMWPACSAPIVGTRPTTSPAQCHERASSRSRAGESITTGPLPGSVLDLVALRLGRRRRPVRGVLVLGPRERPGPHIVGEPLRTASDLFRDAGVALHE